MTVRKGVILAAGFGTRLLPATKAVPKEMLPLLDRPIIQYVAEEAVAAGIRELIVVISAGKESIAHHFSPAPELEQALAAKGDEDSLREVSRLSSLASFCFVYQHERLGTGHALLQARPLIGNDPFALFYPDDIVVGEEPAIAHLVALYEQCKAPVLGVAPVPPQDAHRYGLIDASQEGDNLFRVNRAVEKPSPHEIPSHLAMVGRMVLTPQIFPFLQKTPPGRGGEVWLTDAINLLCQHLPVYASALPGKWLDVGNLMGLLMGSLHLALTHPKWSAQARRLLGELERLP